MDGESASLAPLNCGVRACLQQAGSISVILISGYFSCSKKQIIILFNLNYRSSKMRISILTLIMLFSLGSKSMAQKYYDFTVLAGPALLKFGHAFKVNRVANQFELHYKIQYTKRSSLLLGFGYLTYDKRFNYNVDTTAIYVIKQQGSNPRLNTHQITQLLFFPINYDYQFIRKEKFDISIRGGFELHCFLRVNYSGSEYRILPGGHLDSIPRNFNYESEEIGSKYMQLAPSIGLNFRTLIKNKWYFNASSSINFKTSFNFLRCGVGVSYVQDKFKRTKKKKKKG